MLRPLMGHDLEAGQKEGQQVGQKEGQKEGQQLGQLGPAWAVC